MSRPAQNAAGGGEDSQRQNCRSARTAESPADGAWVNSGGEVRRTEAEHELPDLQCRHVAIGSKDMCCVKNNASKSWLESALRPEPRKWDIPRGFRERKEGDTAWGRSACVRDHFWNNTSPPPPPHVCFVLLHEAPAWSSVAHPTHSSDILHCATLTGQRLSLQPHSWRHA